MGSTEVQAKLAVIAALPREIAGLVRGVAADAELRRRGVWLYRVDGAVVVAAGMGAGRVALAVEAAMAAGDVRVLISVGLAGACTAEVGAGGVVEAGMVIETRTGERYRTVAGEGAPVLATTDWIASVKEKARLRAAYGAAIVDMEAATVGRLAAAHGLGFRAIKAVSDGYDFELAGLGKFAGKDGSFRTGAFAVHTALRPGTWGKAMKLGRDSGRALGALEVALKEVIAGGG